MTAYRKGYVPLSIRAHPRVVTWLWRRLPPRLLPYHRAVQLARLLP